MKSIVTVQGDSEDRMRQCHPDLEIIDINVIYEESQQVAISILTAIHSGIYCETFPIASERETLDDWFGRLRNGDSQLPMQRFFVMGKNLLTPETAEIVGFTVVEYYPQSQAVLLSYLIKNKKYAVGNKEYYDIKPLIFEAYKQIAIFARNYYGHDILAIYSESNKPGLVFYEEGNPESMDVMDPARRLRLMTTKFGTRIMNFDYIQGDIGSGECEDLFLLTWMNNEGNMSLDPHVLKTFLIEFNQYCNEGRSLQIESGQRMMQHVEEMISKQRPILRELTAQGY